MKRNKATLRLYRVLENDEWKIRSLPTYSLASGFRDREKQMIFDGDILREETPPIKSEGRKPHIFHWLVVYDEKMGRFAATRGTMLRDLTDERIREMKIVGDVIRHSALLKV